MFTKTCKYITMLFAILTICAGCDEHSNKDNDPGTQNPIPTCVGDDCTNDAVVCQTAGAVNCNGVCIDPMTSDKYCGANAFCENYVACSGNESCQAGRCRETIVDPTYSCIAEGIVKCDGKDIRPATDNDFCGANCDCMDFKPCSNNQACRAGICEDLNCPTGTHAENHDCVKDGGDPSDNPNNPNNPNDPNNPNNPNDPNNPNNPNDPNDPNNPDNPGNPDNPPLKCDENQHIYQNQCENDTTSTCGSHEVSCKTAIAGWESGKCTNAKCVATDCQTGFHLYNGQCEPDDTDNCGKHEAICSETIEGWAKGSCTDGSCLLSECKTGYHVALGSCEKDDLENCGTHGLECAVSVEGWSDGTCSNGKCVPSKCEPGYHFDNQAMNCVNDTKSCCGVACSACPGQKVCSNGSCKLTCDDPLEVCQNNCVNYQIDIDHCGKCGQACTTAKVQNSSEVACSKGGCIATACQEGFHVYEGKCEQDSETMCGDHSYSCKTLKGWKTGTCTKGACVPQTCTPEYHLTTTHDGTFCEENSFLNCGSHEKTCEKGEACLEISSGQYQCIGSMICDGSPYDVTGDPEHCGSCTNVCPDGQICENAKCKVGMGTAKCNGVYTEMGTLNNCAACGDRCSDGKICEANSCVQKPGYTYCGEEEINTRYNIDHCGNCSHRCGDGLVCQDGACVKGAGMTYCGDVRIEDSGWDSANCGGCNNKCAVGAKCFEGTCKPITSTDPKNWQTGCNLRLEEKTDELGNTYYDINGNNISLYSDSQNCGQCGRECPESAYTCNAGQCIEGNMRKCNGTAVDIKVDSANCGQCGKVCPKDQLCVDGNCKPTSSCSSYTFCPNNSAFGCYWVDCNRGLICNNEFVEDKYYNSNHCGQCNNACAEDEYCHEGECRINPNKICKINGEDRLINILRDSANCGGCGQKCGLGEICMNGSCLTTEHMSQVNCEEFGEGDGYSTWNCWDSQGGNTICNGGDEIINIYNNKNNCGQCGHVCEGDLVCRTSKCIENPIKNCNGEEVDTSFDPYHCGNCTTICGRYGDEGYYGEFYEYCELGLCKLFDGYDKCSDGTVKYVKHDLFNCGACGHVCSDGQACDNGVCKASSACTSGDDCYNVICNDQVINVRYDLFNCGACGHVCNDGQVCDKGECKAPSACTSGNYSCYNVICNNQVIGVRNDLFNCGACGHVCSDGLACDNGECKAPSACTSYYEDYSCYDVICNNQIINVRNDLFNCGACGHVCSDGQACDNGECKAPSACTSGDCYDVICNDQVVNVRNDLFNCGACGHVCNDGQTCINGECKAPSACTSGDDKICNVICNGKAINIVWDSAHCGGCGNVCGPNKRCEYSHCVDNTAGYGNIDCNGIETDIKYDSANCGYCGNICPAGRICNGDGTCTGLAGGTQCNGEWADTLSSPSHCGQCGNRCPDSQICSNAVCKDGVGSTWCGEILVNTANHYQHCGACNNACNEGEICSNGLCVNRPGQTACSGEPTNTLTNAAHCGECNRACQGDAICQNGECRDFCLGIGQVNLDRDSSHCGSCDNACGSSLVCIKGACKPKPGVGEACAVDNSGKWICADGVKFYSYHNYLTDQSTCICGGQRGNEGEHCGYNGCFGECYGITCQSPLTCKPFNDGEYACQ